MKLSTALAIGIQKRPEQCFGESFQGNNASCVLGAINDGLGYPNKVAFKYTCEFGSKLKEIFT